MGGRRREDGKWGELGREEGREGYGLLRKEGGGATRYHDN